MTDGRLWGVLATLTAGRRRPPKSTGRSLQQSAGPTAVAVATAQARADLHELAEEQAALRRVAELVARAASPPDVFAAVAAEASRLVHGEPMTLTRFEGERELVVVAAHGGPAPVGTRITYQAGTLPDWVRRGAKVSRVEDYTRQRDARLAEEFGLAAAVSAPVVVAGKAWGMLTATSGVRPLPPGTEYRLEQFAKLVAAALANSQWRTDLETLADEQAALHRVAELVARGAALDEVFTSVAVEASHLLADVAVALLRYEPDGFAVIVAACNGPVARGLRFPVHDGPGLGEVLRTGRPSRVDDFRSTPLADVARELGVRAGIAVPVIVEGRVWGTLSSSSAGPPVPVGTEERLLQFAELATAAIANAENKAKLTASRARVVATADETRRGLQRDLHDGAQQRLVHTIIMLKLARGAILSGGAAAELVEEALHNAERASAELRDVVRGILPAALTRGGLRTGVGSLVADLVLPVDVEITAPRLPAHTETTAYFVVAEALTNVVKHAHASRATVHIALEDDTLTIDVRDDGSGGVDPAQGTGLTGLLDRVDAAEGTLTITSRAALGTTVHATLPAGRTTASPPTPLSPSRPV